MKLSESYSIPDHLWREIHRYDPRVEVTWNGRKGLVDVSRFGQHILSFEPTPDNFYKLYHTLRNQDIWARDQGAKYGSQVIYEETEENAARAATRIQNY